MALSFGKQFEKDIENSCVKDKIFYYRIKDNTGAFNPACMKCPKSKMQFTVKNECDAFIYNHPILIPVEFKSTKSKSVSTDEKIIKPQQIKRLTEWQQYKGVWPCFIFNFRESNNQTFALHIKYFNDYIANPNRKNKSSIPIAYCEEVGIKIQNQIKKVHYSYDINGFITIMYQQYLSVN